jgi:hypothetical protein
MQGGVKGASFVVGLDAGTAVDGRRSVCKVVFPPWNRYFHSLGLCRYPSKGRKTYDFRA